MSHFDRLETRTPLSRENALFRDLRAVLGQAKSRASSLRFQLRGIELAELKKRADLARIPVVRKSDLKQMQGENLPFGGLAATRIGALKRILVSPGPIFEPEGQAKDWWGAARALFAAGIAKGDILINCFSYHMTPGGHIMESGAHALGCAVIPAGTGNTEHQCEAIHHLKPKAYCGTPDFLKILLDKGTSLGLDMSSIKNALVSGAALPASLRQDLNQKGIRVHQAYATADLGVIAFESEAFEGIVVNEGLIVEIVRPGTGDPVPEGEVGEVLVTRLNADYPLLRFATGDLSAIMPGHSPCGRTNLRLKGWMGRADQTTKVKGMFVHPSHIAEIGRRHPCLGRLRLVVTRHNEQDVMALHAEDMGGAAQIHAQIAESLHTTTSLRGHVELVRPGSLPNDGKVIADERPIA